MNALDVIHSFWVPEWRIKKDAVPGHYTTSVAATPDAEGTYSLICTEYCGTGHATMRAFVEVESAGGVRRLDQASRRRSRRARRDSR